MKNNTILLLLILIGYACNKKDNPIPCIENESFKAGFTIFQELEDTAIACDTVFLHSYVKFLPNMEANANLWKINYIDFIDSSASLQLFVNDGLGSHVNISLEQMYLANTSCFLQKTDTILTSKFFYITDFSNSLIKGQYKGAIVGNESDTFTISIQYFDKPLPNYFLSNLPKGCSRTTYDGYPSDIGYSLNVGYRFFSFEQSTCLPGITHGFGFLKGTDSLIITYLTADPYNANNLIKETFLGKRVL